MSKEKTTAGKRNAYNIRGAISQAIFREYIFAQGEESYQFTAFAKFDRLSLSALAGIAARAIMKEPRLNVVLRKNQAS